MTSTIWLYMQRNRCPVLLPSSDTFKDLWGLRSLILMMESYVSHGLGRRAKSAYRVQTLLQKKYWKKPDINETLRLASKGLLPIHTLLILLYRKETVPQLSLLQCYVPDRCGHHEHTDPKRKRERRGWGWGNNPLFDLCASSRVRCPYAAQMQAVIGCRRNRFI